MRPFIDDEGAFHSTNENNAEYGKDLADSESPSDAKSLDKDYLEDCL